jgi:uncharacterized protein (DUF58 family)
VTGTPAGPARSGVQQGPRRLRSRRPAGAILAVLLAALWLWLLAGATLGLLVAVALGVALVCDAVLAWRGSTDPELEVELPPRATAHEPLVATIRLALGRSPVRITAPWAPEPVEYVVDRDRPGALVLPGTGRGIAHALVLDATVSGPLSLVECTFRLRARSAPLAVTARPAPYAVMWPSWRTTSVGVDEMAPRGHELFRGVREYTRGDPRRIVHWKATARHGALMVREAEGRGFVALRVVLDLPDHTVTTEAALERAAFVLREALRRRWALLVVTVEPALAATPATLGRVGTQVWAPDLGGRPTGGSGAAQTVAGWVRSRQQADLRLAAAGVGVPSLGPWQGSTVVIGPEGDTWS